MNGTFSMTMELRMLILSAALGIVQLLVVTTASTMKRGLKWNAGPRDVAMPPLTGMAGRMDRAFQNFKETFPLFLAAVLLVELSGKHSDLSASGAQLYFWGRLIYFPIYIWGVSYFRTMVWTFATLGIALMMVAVV